MATPELPSIEAIDTCISRLGLRTIETVHPASQYWPLQLLEAGIFIAAATALLIYAAWRVRRRLGD